MLQNFIYKTHVRFTKMYKDIKNKEEFKEHQVNTNQTSKTLHLNN
jgi:hypothetical protein